MSELGKAGRAKLVQAVLKMLTKANAPNVVLFEAPTDPQERAQWVNRRIRREGMTSDNLALDQLLLALAGAKRECPVAGTGPDGTCTSCGGKGWVYVLPKSVREPCPGPVCLAGWFMHDSTCCGGTGYIPSRSLEVWLEAAALYDTKGQAPILWPHYSSDDGLTWIFQWQGTAWWGEADTPLEAVLRALAKRLEVLPCGK